MIDSHVYLLTRLATIANAFDRDELKEAGPEREGIGDGFNPTTVTLFSKLADAFAAREALGAAPAPPAPAPDDWRQRVTTAIEKIMIALDAQGALPAIEGERMDRAREAVAALTATTPAPTKGNQIEVLHNGLWHVYRIIRDEDACWRVQVLQPPLPDSDIVWPFELTVWKANTSSWRRPR